MRLVAIGDTNAAVADDTAKRYGYERAEYDWRAIADAADVDAVSVVVANHLHREIVEGLIAAGKHVLCEKPLAGSLADAEAMVAAAAAQRTDVTAVGYTYRRAPAVGSRSGVNWPRARSANFVHFNGPAAGPIYALDPIGADLLALPRRARDRALADVGSHLIDLSEFVCRSDRGGKRRHVRHPDRSSARAARCRPTAAKGAVSDELARSTMSSAFTARSENGAIGSLLGLARRTSLPDGLAFELFEPRARPHSDAPPRRRIPGSRPTTSAATSVVRGEC